MREPAGREFREARLDGSYPKTAIVVSFLNLHTRSVEESRSLADEPERPLGHVYTPADPVSAEVGLVYDDPSWDHVIVRESIDTTSQDGLIKFDESLVNRGCSPIPEQGPDAVSCDYDPFAQVDIRNGIIALLGSTPEGTGTGVTSLEWVEPLNRTGIGGGIPPGNNMVIQVVGYATTFSPDEATQFGKAFTASTAA